MRQLGLVPVLFFTVLVGACAAEPPKQGGKPTPSLIVAIVVDQYSADLFEEYRAHYQYGLARLAGGVVFPHGYQSHAATETCPGHSTILTGARPGHTGIVANDWQEPAHPHQEEGKEVFGRYCVEKIDATGAKSITPETLLVPTLGDRMRASNPDSRVVAIAGKDRAAVTLGGKDASLTLWWERNKGFVTYRDARLQPGMLERIDRVNATVKQSYESTTQPKVPPLCAGRTQQTKITDEVSVGELQAIEAKQGRWRATPAFDLATLKMATDAVDEMRLGRGKSIDLLAVSFSANDYVGHYYGTHGQEMCAQQVALDETIGKLLAHLDKTGVSYVVALTADHGGLDIPERNSMHSVPDAQRIAKELAPGAVGDAVAKQLGLPGPLLLGQDFNSDVYLHPSIAARLRPAVLDAVRKKYLGSSQVAQVFTKNELIAAEAPSGPPDEWTLLERAKASFNAERSGDLVVLIKPYVTVYGKPDKPDRDYIASHGSPWGYDRRVPIIFWWRGMTGFEQPAAVETVDIAPTLADVIGLKVGAPEMDGRVLAVGQGSRR